eukprot:m.62116 g.62116  ORF g.62116 m.62116 type:complete len:311 (+) comp13918_c0_seq2:3-935(+)
MSHRQGFSKRRKHGKAHGPQPKQPKRLESSAHIPLKVAQAILSSHPLRLRQLLGQYPSSVNQPHGLGTPLFTLPLSLALGMLFKPASTLQIIAPYLRPSSSGVVADSLTCVQALLNHHCLNPDLVFYDSTVTPQTALSYLYGLQNTHNSTIIDGCIRQLRQLQPRYYCTQVDIIAQAIANTRMQLVDSLLEELQPCLGPLQREQARRPSDIRLGRWLAQAVQQDLLPTVYLLLQLGARPEGLRPSLTSLCLPLLRQAEHVKNKSSGTIATLQWHCYCRAYACGKLSAVSDHEIKAIFLKQLQPGMQAIIS